MKKIHVTDEYRTNPMSLKPGGSVVEVYHESGKILEYDKVKFPYKYVREIYPKIDKVNNRVMRIDVDGESVFLRSEQVDVFGLL